LPLFDKWCELEMIDVGFEGSVVKYSGLHYSDSMVEKSDEDRGGMSE